MEEEKQQALDNYRRDKFAATARGPRAARRGRGAAGHRAPGHRVPRGTGSSGPAGTLAKPPIALEPGERLRRQRHLNPTHRVEASGNQAKINR